MEAQSNRLGRPVLLTAAFVAFLFALAAVSYVLYAGVSSYACDAPAAVYPRNAVLFVVNGDMNSVRPMVAFARAHGLVPVMWDISRAPAFVRIGDLNLPLAPPAVTLPAYICAAKDGNHLIGYFGADLNVFRLVVSHCAGYTGPVYVLDRNTGRVVEVNS